MAQSPAEVALQNVALMVPFVAPIVVYRAGEQVANNWLTGGTGLLAQTAKNRFLITADHLAIEIDRLRLSHPVEILLGGNACEDMSTWPLLSWNRDVDICTYQVPAKFDPGLLGKQFFELSNWPHPRAQVGEPAFVIGYPAEHRSADAHSVQTAFGAISDFVSDVGPYRFTLADESQTRKVQLLSKGFAVLDSHGGMSGSPIFRLVAPARPELIGVFSEGGDGFNATFFGAHADVLDEDGRLNDLRIPPR